jgi:phosphoglycerate dehydrogenase-like enzyme
MIGEKDLAPLHVLSDVDYFELASISEDELVKKCKGYDFLMLNMDVLPKKGSIKLTENFYDHPNIKGLKTIAIDMTGMDYFSPEAASAAGVMLQNIPHYSSQSVAESILAEVLLHSRQRHLAYIDEMQQKKIVARKGINLKNRTVGILGYGSIGSTIAKMFSALEMNVLVWNRSLKSDIAITSLEDIFEKSDIICITMKTVIGGQDSNINMIGVDLLERCKGSIIVNLANESLVDLSAMASALSAGKVLAYSVEDSATSRDKLDSYPNVHFAPHNAWDSDESMQTLREVWVSNVISVIEGHPKNVYSE